MRHHHIGKQEIEIGAGRKLRYKGRARNRAWFKITTAVYNIVRITTLDAATA